MRSCWSVNWTGLIIYLWLIFFFQRLLFTAKLWSLHSKTKIRFLILFNPVNLNIFINLFYRISCIVPSLWCLIHLITLYCFIWSSYSRDVFVLQIPWTWTMLILNLNLNINYQNTYKLQQFLTLTVIKWTSKTTLSFIRVITISKLDTFIQNILFVWHLCLNYDFISYRLRRFSLLKMII